MTITILLEKLQKLKHKIWLSDVLHPTVSEYMQWHRENADMCSQINRIICLVSEGGFYVWDIKDKLSQIIYNLRSTYRFRELTPEDVELNNKKVAIMEEIYLVIEYLQNG